jgi:hypothetical protein
LEDLKGVTVSMARAAANAGHSFTQRMMPRRGPIAPHALLDPTSSIEAHVAFTA